MLPLCIICFTIIFNIQRYADNAYKDNVQHLVRTVSDFTEYLVDTAEKKCYEIARTSACANYLNENTADNNTIAQIIRLCSHIAEGGIYEPYVIPVTKSLQPLGAGNVPIIYKTPAGTHWGILDKLTNNNNSEPMIEVQPHFDSGNSIMMSVGIPFFINNNLKGYIVTDIKRDAFSNIETGQLGTINDMLITDSRDCVMYSLLKIDRENHFLDELQIDKKNNISIDNHISYGLTVTVLYPKLAMKNFSEQINSLTMTLVLISIICGIICSLLISQSISRPVIQLTDAMHKVEKGDLSVQCLEPRKIIFFKNNYDDIHFLIERFNYMVSRINILMQEAVLKQKFLRDAEVRNLQSQINPHFLYNTLNSIKSIAKLQGSNDAAEMVTILARILREGVSQQDMTTIRDAVALAKDYFLIESYRWPGRFIYKENIDEQVLNIKIPKLVIQPVVENALIHGLEAKSGNGTLEISAGFDNDMILIKVTDDGIGIEEKVLADIQKSLDNKIMAVEKTSLGIALINTHRRLKLLYGTSSGLTIKSELNKGTCIEIRYSLEQVQDV